MDLSDIGKLKLPTSEVKVNAEFLSQLELLDAGVYPLPGGSVRRGSGMTLGVDARLNVHHPLSTDVLTFYEHVASVRHKPTGRIYVAFRETMDALLMRQQDPELYPKWLMDHPVKRTELSIYIMQAKANPKPISAAKGLTEMWFKQWLTDIEDARVHATLAYYLVNSNVVKQGYKVA